MGGHLGTPGNSVIQKRLEDLAANPIFPTLVLPFFHSSIFHVHILLEF